jgi:O-antigen/teichoic acid export membrane protein
MGSSGKIVSGVIWSTLTNVVGALYGFIAVPILIQYFGKAEYGLIGLAMSVNVYMRLMDMGFSSTNVRFYSKWLTEKQILRLKSGFQTSLSFYGIIGLLNATILLVVAYFSHSLFNVNDEQDVILKNLFYILAVVAFCNWFSSCFDQLIRATENVAWIQKRTLFTKILQIIVLAITVWCNLSIELYYALTCLATLSIVPVSIGKIRKETPFVSLLPNFDKSVFLEMLPYCLNVFSLNLFHFSFLYLRPVFLGMRGTMESVADFRVLNGIASMVMMLGGAFTAILLPSSAKVVAKKDREAYYRLAYDGTKYISILNCFCCFGMMSVASEVITLYVGVSFLYLVPWLNLWLLCTLATHHNQAISSLILAGTDLRPLSYSTAIFSVVGLIITWILIPSYQIGGVCIALLVFNSLHIGFYYLYYWPRRMQINSWKVFSYSFMPYVLVGILTYFFIQIMPTSGIPLYDFLIKGFVFAIAYVIVVVFTLNSDDKKFLVSIFKKRNNNQ